MLSFAMVQGSTDADQAQKMRKISNVLRLINGTRTFTMNGTKKKILFRLTCLNTSAVKPSFNVKMNH